MIRKPISKTPKLTIDELRALNNKQRKPMSHEESHLQIACVRWFRLVHPDLVLFAIPNAAKRGKALASIMKNEGILAGASDLMLMVQCNGYGGLFIEMKTEKGKQSDTQKEFESKCFTYGYKYALCRSFDEFREIITNYLKL